MAIDFPTSPTNGQTLVVNGSTYTWNSSATTWDLTTTTVIGPTGPTGPTGAASTVTGPTGATGPTGPAPYYVQSAAPTTTIVGSTWTDTDDGRTYVWSGSQWFEPYDNLMGPTGSSGSSGVISVTSPITNSGTSSSATIGIDAGQLTYVTFLMMGA